MRGHSEASLRRPFAFRRMRLTLCSSTSIRSFQNYYYIFFIDGLKTSHFVSPTSFPRESGIGGCHSRESPQWVGIRHESESGIQCSIDSTRIQLHKRYENPSKGQETIQDSREIEN